MPHNSFAVAQATRQWRRYGLPPDQLPTIFERDGLCVYCHTWMVNWGSTAAPLQKWRTVEHFDNDGPLDDPANVGFACNGCNTSKWTKTLSDWLKTPYCVSRNITRYTVAEPVKIYLAREAA
jgi:hypothetical protein